MNTWVRACGLAFIGRPLRLSTSENENDNNNNDKNKISYDENYNLVFFISCEFHTQLQTTYPKIELFQHVLRLNSPKHAHNILRLHGIFAADNQYKPNFKSIT